MFRKFVSMMLASAVLSALFVSVNVSAQHSNREDHNRADTVTMYGYTSDYAIVTEDGVMHEVDDYNDDSYYTYKCVKCEVEPQTGDIVSFEYLCVLNAEKKLARAGYKSNIKTIFSEPADHDWGIEKDDWMVVKAYNETGEDVIAEVLIEDGIIGDVVEYK